MGTLRLVRDLEVTLCFNNNVMSEILNFKIYTNEACLRDLLLLTLGDYFNYEKLLNLINKYEELDEENYLLLNKFLTRIFNKFNIDYIKFVLDDHIKIIDNLNNFNEYYRGIINFVKFI